MSKRAGRVTCSVVGCKNRYCNTEESVKFYSFPSRPHEMDLRRRWILAVNRKKVDGTLWMPSKSSRICSEHFIGGRKSQHPASPAYIPSIFPECYRRKSPGIGSLERFARLKNRNVNRYSVVSTPDISELQDSEPVLVTVRTGAQTQSKRNCAEESNFESSCVLDGDSVSTQAMEVALVSDIKTEPPTEERPSEDSISKEHCRNTASLHNVPEEVFVVMPKTEPEYLQMEESIKEEFPQYHNIKQEICIEEVNVPTNRGWSYGDGGLGPEGKRPRPY
ncbi:THAP domain-containing protein 11 isoform X2 [Anabrus simplex]|uniref:THAP domain-containing protein 11 isoform X2 n=1 Tax=Anabrus simplex TaxID=316456 RepID=UPI0035A39AC5